MLDSILVPSAPFLAENFQEMYNKILGAYFLQRYGFQLGPYLRGYKCRLRKQLRELGVSSNLDSVSKTFQSKNAIFMGPRQKMHAIRNFLKLYEKKLELFIAAEAEDDQRKRLEQLYTVLPSMDFMDYVLNNEGLRPTDLLSLYYKAGILHSSEIFAQGKTAEVILGYAISRFYNLISDIKMSSVKKEIIYLSISRLHLDIRMEHDSSKILSSVSEIGKRLDILEEEHLFFREREYVRFMRGFCFGISSRYTV